MANSCHSLTIHAAGRFQSDADEDPVTWHTRPCRLLYKEQRLRAVCCFQLQGNPRGDPPSPPHLPHLPEYRIRIPELRSSELLHSK